MKHWSEILGDYVCAEGTADENGCIPHPEGAAELALQRWSEEPSMGLKLASALNGASKKDACGYA